MSKLTFDQLLNLKLLLSVEGIGPGRIRNLLAKFRTLEKIISADSKSLKEVEGISDNLTRRIQKINSQREVVESSLKKDLDLLDKINGKIITVWDESFPPLLKKIYDPPLLLYIRGSFLKEDEYSIAIVGTRGPTNYGKIQAEKIATELASQNITIVSGLARG
ncbi:MAG TPA: DNA-processing protein DprA, partial [Ignavibacteriaceae bacterium]|nr:DNA-processing protein DprA [Ignavibacteriaceae bacterium]